MHILQILDPSGVILQSVCEPLSLYLKSRDNRDNTVRIIVSSLTDENNVELSAELAKCSQVYFLKKLTDIFFLLRITIWYQAQQMRKATMRPYFELNILFNQSSIRF